MPTVIATVGAVDANSYVSRDAATTLLDARLNATAWTAASNDDKDRALIMATAALDRIEWNPMRVGYRVNLTQALRFPAYGVIKRFYDDYYDETAIPDFITQATVEAALGFLESDRLTEPSRDRSVASESVGSLSRSYFEGVLSPVDQLANPVWEIIEFWAASRSSTFGGIGFGEAMRTN